MSPFIVKPIWTVLPRLFLIVVPIFIECSDKSRKKPEPDKDER